MINFLGIDHVVFTVASIEKTLWFYCDLLGMEQVTFAGGRKAIKCGNQKFNLHLAGKEFEPKASKPTPGSIDICLITDTPLKTVIEELNVHNVSIVEGPVEKTGSHGKLLSVYLRDPDQNLIEISNYL